MMIVKVYTNENEPGRQFILHGEPRKLGGKLWTYFEIVHLEDANTLHRRYVDPDNKRSMFGLCDLLDYFHLLGEFNITREIFP
jgi:hypothetical protein